MNIRIYFAALFSAFTIGLCAQTDEVTLPKVGMRDTLVERLVRENVFENHGTPKEIIIESKGWIIIANKTRTTHKYVDVSARYVDSTGDCWLIQYQVEARFNPDTHKFDPPYCRGNGYGQGVEMKCE